MWLFSDSQRHYVPRGESTPGAKNLASLVAATLHPMAVRHVLHSPEAIRAILHRECARCERSGSEFCLVVIDPGTNRAATKQLRKLLAIDVRRADEIGLLDERHLCVFLPYTRPAGAKQFIDRFEQRAHAAGWKPVVDLFVYPSDTLDRRAKTPPTEKVEVPANDGPDGGHTPAAGLEEFLAQRSPTWKRLTDICFAGLGLLFLWPVIVSIAVAIKLSSKGPIFFSQWRLGLGGKPFRILKFRTMVPDADRLKKEMLHQNEQDGPAFKMAKDPRVTRIGRLLRVTSLDELPQLWNVVRGDMSLVGPRPLPVDESNACSTWQKRRLDVKPGLTCTWQISGRGTVSFADWARMDRDYIRRQSFTNDVKLLALTVPAVLGRRGAM